MKFARIGRRGLVGITLGLTLCAIAPGVSGRKPPANPATFQDPLLDHGPDPWVIRDNGYYYFMASTGSNITIRRTRDITRLRDAETKVVWTPPANGPYSKEIWAPELHKLNGKWYLYFAADDGSNDDHRMYVLENATDPFDGEWTFKGKVSDPSDRWAIDGTVFVNDGRGGDGKLYMLWSGWEGARNGQQNIYLARMSNPWTIDGQRVMVSHPQYDWERIGAIDAQPVLVNEGPEILQHDGRVFLTYSASGCWTDEYKLGVLEASAGADLMAPSNWRKRATPVFRSDPAARAYAPGHNGFFKSPDGREDWIIYHANPGPGQGCGGKRSPRAQRFSWSADGRPLFGKPVAIDTAQKIPGGTR